MSAPRSAVPFARDRPALPAIKTGFKSGSSSVLAPSNLFESPFVRVVAPHLASALAQTVALKPQDPIGFLSDMLFKEARTRDATIERSVAAARLKDDVAREIENARIKEERRITVLREGRILQRKIAIRAFNRKLEAEVAQEEQWLRKKYNGVDNDFLLKSKLQIIASLIRDDDIEDEMSEDPIHSDVWQIINAFLSFTGYVKEDGTIWDGFGSILLSKALKTLIGCGNFFKRLKAYNGLISIGRDRVVRAIELLQDARGSSDTVMASTHGVLAAKLYQYLDCIIQAFQSQVKPLFSKEAMLNHQQQLESVIGVTCSHGVEMSVLPGQDYFKIPENLVNESLTLQVVWAEEGSHCSEVDISILLMGSTGAVVDTVFHGKPKSNTGCTHLSIPQTKKSPSGYKHRRGARKTEGLINASESESEGDEELSIPASPIETHHTPNNRLDPVATNFPVLHSVVPIDQPLHLSHVSPLMMCNPSETDILDLAKADNSSGSTPSTEKAVVKNAASTDPGNTVIDVDAAIITSSELELVDTTGTSNEQKFKDESSCRGDGNVDTNYLNMKNPNRMAEEGKSWAWERAGDVLQEIKGETFRQHLVYQSRAATFTPSIADPNVVAHAIILGASCQAESMESIVSVDIILKTKHGVVVAFGHMDTCTMVCQEMLVGILCRTKAAVSEHASAMTAMRFIREPSQNVFSKGEAGEMSVVSDTLVNEWAFRAVGEDVEPECVILERDQSDRKALAIIAAEEKALAEAEESMVGVSEIGSFTNTDASRSASTFTTLPEEKSKFAITPGHSRTLLENHYFLNAISLIQFYLKYDCLVEQCIISGLTNVNPFMMERHDKFTISNHLICDPNVIMRIGCGWQGVPVRGGSNQEVDCDLCVLAFRGDKYYATVDFMQSELRGGGMWHQGDDRTGGIGGDNEIVEVDLSKISTEVDSVFVLCTIFDQRQSFKNVASLHCRLSSVTHNEYGEEKEKEMCRTIVGAVNDLARGSTAVILGKLFRIEREDNRLDINNSNVRPSASLNTPTQELDAGDEDDRIGCEEIIGEWCFEAIKQVSGGRSADDVRKFIEEKLLSDGRKKERRNAVIW